MTASGGQREGDRRIEVRARQRCGAVDAQRDAQRPTERRRPDVAEPCHVLDHALIGGRERRRPDAQAKRGQDERAHDLADDLSGGRRLGRRLLEQDPLVLDRFSSHPTLLVRTVPVV
jgi:hypothetical protein